MDAATAARLIAKSGQTCSIVAYGDGLPDRYGNVTTDVGTETAGVPCLFVTPMSSRRGEFTTPETEGLRDMHVLYLAGTREVDTDDVIETIVQNKYGGGTIGDGPYEITRIDRSLVPLVTILQLAEAS
jgi:hypothetical protein